MAAKPSIFKVLTVASQLPLSLGRGEGGMNTMRGPWKARGDDPRVWRRPVARIEAVAMAAAHEVATVFAWVASVAVGAAVLMLLAQSW